MFLALVIDRRFRGVYCLYHQDPDGGRIKYFWNVGKVQPDYMAQHPRKQSSSYSPPREPEISPSKALWELIFQSIWKPICYDIKL
jgi:hypothetical protein